MYNPNRNRLDNPTKTLLKVKDQFRDKVIKKGFLKTNPSLGMLWDQNAAWVGYPTVFD